MQGRACKRISMGGRLSQRGAVWQLPSCLLRAEESARWTFRHWSAYSKTSCEPAKSEGISIYLTQTN